jgi:hypothetical protein
MTAPNVIKFREPQTYADIADPVNEGLLDIGRGRTHLTAHGTQTEDARQAWLSYRALCEESNNLHEAAQIVLKRYERLEGRG